MGVVDVNVASGAAFGNEYVGGLIGDNGGDIRNCAASGDVTGRRQIGLLVGRNYGSPIDNSMGTGALTEAN